MLTNKECFCVILAVCTFNVLSSFSHPINPTTKQAITINHTRTGIQRSTKNANGHNTTQTIPKTTSMNKTLNMNVIISFLSFTILNGVLIHKTVNTK